MTNNISGLLFFVSFIFIISFQNGFGQGKDIFDEALKDLNLQKDEIGIESKTYWTGYPQNVSYKFNAFDELFREPLEMYDFSKVISSSVEYLLSERSIKNSKTNIYNAVYYSAISKHNCGSRGYLPINVNLKTNSLKGSLQRLILNSSVNNSSDKVGFEHQIASIDSLFFEKIPIAIRYEIASLIENINTAYYWQKLAFRNIDSSLLQLVYNIRDFNLSQYDGQIYYHQFDDCEKLIDKESLIYSSSILIAATDIFRYNCDSIFKSTEFDSVNLSISVSTPIGKIIINGNDNDIYDTDEEYLLIIDFGGNDQYYGSVGATASVNNPISILIDFSGNDLYSNTDPGKVAQGAGILGTGILFDLDGKDVYKSINYSQGIGVFGTGLLFDYRGNDEYILENSGQGCGYFGIGLNFDITGDDKYYIFGDGQGMGGVGGIGILANHQGDDKYIAEQRASLYEKRADYHSKYRIMMNYAQGAGVGRRGDLTDGHNWAGGIGALIDIEGNDLYKSGNFSQGIGYWFGLGILFDGKGDDIFESVYFSQASAAHFAMGVLIDEEGNDQHKLTKTGGAGLSFGWDFANTLFVDFEGDDYYETKMVSLANSMLRSNTFFIEMSGNDVYKVNSLDNFFGASENKKYFQKMYFSKDYAYDAIQSGFFFDLSGDDQYLLKDQDKWVDHPKIKNNSKWFQPRKKDAVQSKNYGIGIDCKSGSFNRFDKWKQ